MNNNNYLQLSKEELIKQINELTQSTQSRPRKVRSDKGSKHEVHKSERKPRSDAGRIRGPNSKVRSDKGVQRKSITKVQMAKVSVYLSQRNRLLSRDDICIVQDINGFYVPLERDNAETNEPYSVIVNGSKRTRTVHYRVQPKIDLEQRRFDALQEIARPIVLDEKLRDIFAQEISKVCDENHLNSARLTGLDLFCQFYHVKEEEYIMWNYEHWRSDYLVVCHEKLTDIADGFTFSIAYSPGSDEFLPEYKDNVLSKEQIVRASLENSREYALVAARYRDELLSKQRMKLMSELLKENAYQGMSMPELNRVIEDRVDRIAVSEAVTLYMNDWVNEHLNSQENNKE